MPITSQTKPQLAIAARLAELARRLEAVEAGEVRSPGRRLAAQAAQFVAILARATAEDRLWQRAAALTYTSILSLFPVLFLLSSAYSFFYSAEQQDALVNSVEQWVMPPSSTIVTDGFGGAEEEELMQRLKSAIAEMSTTYRDSAGGLGLLGFLGVLLTAGILYRSIETAVEAAWQTGHPGSIVRSLMGFTSFLIFGPVIVGLSLAASSTLVRVTTGSAPFVLQASPVLFNSLVLALAYMLFPMTKVRLRHALVGGLTAGILWELAKVGFVAYIYLSATSMQFFKAFGAIPIFLIWLYFTWIVFLLGNQITYVSQNLEVLKTRYFRSRPFTHLDGRLLLALAGMVADAFERGAGSVPEERILRSFRLPFDVLRVALGRLEQAGILQRTASEALTLGRPASRVTVREILALGSDPVGLLDEAEEGDGPWRAELAEINGRILEGAGDATLASLVQHPGA